MVIQLEMMNVLQKGLLVRNGSLEIVLGKMIVLCRCFLIAYEIKNPIPG